MVDMCAGEINGCSSCIILQSASRPSVLDESIATTAYAISIHNKRKSSIPEDSLQNCASEISSLSDFCFL
jgi:hypothetical protein